MAEIEPCASCYQKDVCEIVNNPLYLNWRSGRLEPDEGNPHNPFDCYGHCCRAGVLAAEQTIKDAKSNHRHGLLPFGTVDHKPFLSDGQFTGRYVAFGSNELGLKDGDVIICAWQRNLRLTNVFTHKAPK